MNRPLRAWVRYWHHVMCNRRTLRELDAISATKRDDRANTVGLSGTDPRRFNCTHEGPTELMPARLRELGIDPAFVKYARTETYRDLERACATCKSWRRCANDLAKGDAQAGMDSYCLNGPTIDSLTVDWPVRAQA